MESRAITEQVFQERFDLADALADEDPEEHLQTIGLFMADKYAYLEYFMSVPQFIPRGSTGWVIPRPPQMAVHGLDVAATLAAGGFVLSLEFESGEDAVFAVLFQRQRKTVQPVLCESLNTADTTGVFRAKVELLREALQAWLRSMLEPFNRVVERCLCVKEELMMRAWHPDRVMRLLEAGIDMEDM